MKNKQIGRVTPEQWQQLEETLAGVIPPNCRRMVVDIGHPVIAIGRTAKGGE